MGRDDACWIAAGLLLFVIWASCVGKWGKSTRGGIAVVLGMAVFVWKTGWWSPLWMFGAWVATLFVGRGYFLMGAHALTRWWERFPQTQEEHDRRVELLRVREPLLWRIRSAVTPCILFAGLLAVRSFAGTQPDAALGTLFSAATWLLCEVRGALTIACLSDYEWETDATATDRALAPVGKLWTIVGLALLASALAVPFVLPDRRPFLPSIGVAVAALVVLSLLPSARGHGGLARAVWGIGAPCLVLAGLIAWELTGEPVSASAPRAETDAMEQVMDEFHAVMKAMESGERVISDADVAPLLRALADTRNDGDRARVFRELSSALEETGAFRVAFARSIQATRAAHAIVRDPGLVAPPRPHGEESADGLGLRKLNDQRLREADDTLARIAAGPVTWTLPGGEPRELTEDVAHDLVVRAGNYQASCRVLAERLRSATR